MRPITRGSDGLVAPGLSVLSEVAAPRARSAHPGYPLGRQGQTVHAPTGDGRAEHPDQDEAREANAYECTGHKVIFRLSGLTA